jgi:hypothetical protein
MDSLSSTHLIATALAGAYSLKAGAQDAVAPPSCQRQLLIGPGLGAGKGFVGGLQIAESAFMTKRVHLRVVGDKHVCIPCSGYDR